jgi:hypothetical protein
MSLLLADASTRIALVLKSQAAMPTQSTYKVIESINSARGCLNQLATTKIGAVCKALSQVSDVVEEINAVYLATYIPTYPRGLFLDSYDTEDSELVQSDSHNLNTTLSWQENEFEFLPLSQLVCNFNRPL